MFFWFGHWVLGFVLGLLMGIDMVLIIWSEEQECSVEWVSVHMQSGNYESDFVQLLIGQILAVKPPG